MNNVFTNIFAKQPEEIINGDYYFPVPEFDVKTSEENVKRVDRNIRESFKEYWDSKTLEGDLHPFYDENWLLNIKGENKDYNLIELIKKIACGNDPFMDIASSASMGLATYFLKMNTNRQCLITDINSHEMQVLRACIDKEIPEYKNRINIASFDNWDMPIMDNSLDCITSRYGVSSSGSTLRDNKIIYKYQLSTGTEKVIDEIYRVLKPGGYFATVEMKIESDYDIKMICDNYKENGKLFGVYAYDEIQKVCEVLIDESWRDKFSEQGFKIEAEKKYYNRYTTNKLKRFLYNFTYYNNIRSWTDEEKALYLKYNSTEPQYDDDLGIDLYDTDTLYILQKPY
jgi:Methylase involved in ubiquinone/menaquinone biosynthesis